METIEDAISAHCQVLYGQGKTSDQAYLILVEAYNKADICSKCILEIYK